MRCREHIHAPCAWPAHPARPLTPQAAATASGRRLRGRTHAAPAQVHQLRRVEQRLDAMHDRRPGSQAEDADCADQRVYVLFAVEAIRVLLCRLAPRLLRARSQQHLRGVRAVAWSATAPSCGGGWQGAGQCARPGPRLQLAWFMVSATECRASARRALRRAVGRAGLEFRVCAQAIEVTWSRISRGWLGVHAGRHACAAHAPAVGDRPHQELRHEDADVHYDGCTHRGRGGRGCATARPKAFPRRPCHCGIPSPCARCSAAHLC